MKIMKNVKVNILVLPITVRLGTTTVRDFSTLPATKIKYVLHYDGRIILNKIKTIS